MKLLIAPLLMLTLFCPPQLRAERVGEEAGPEKCERMLAGEATEVGVKYSPEWVHQRAVEFLNALLFEGPIFQSALRDSQVPEGSKLTLYHLSMGFAVQPVPARDWLFRDRSGYSNAVKSIRSTLLPSDFASMQKRIHEMLLSKGKKPLTEKEISEISDAIISNSLEVWSSIDSPFTPGRTDGRISSRNVWIPLHPAAASDKLHLVLKNFSAFTREDWHWLGTLARSLTYRETPKVGYWMIIREPEDELRKHNDAAQRIRLYVKDYLRVNLSTILQLRHGVMELVAQRKMSLQDALAQFKTVRYSLQSGVNRGQQNLPFLPVSMSGGEKPRGLTIGTDIDDESEIRLDKSDEPRLENRNETLLPAPKAPAYEPVIFEKLAARAYENSENSLIQAQDLMRAFDQTLDQLPARQNFKAEIGRLSLLAERDIRALQSQLGYLNQKAKSEITNLDKLVSASGEALKRIQERLARLPEDLGSDMRKELQQVTLEEAELLQLTMAQSQMVLEERHTYQIRWISILNQLEALLRQLRNQEAATGQYPRELAEELRSKFQQLIDTQMSLSKGEPGFEPL